MKPVTFAWLLSAFIAVSASFISNIAACQPEKAASEEAMMFNQRGWELFQKGKYHKALYFFEMAFQCNPSDAYAYSMRNFCYQEEVLKNRAAIISLHREISINKRQIEQLQNECSANHEIIKALEYAVLENQGLAFQLQREFAKNDSLMNVLCSEVFQNKEFVEQLQNAITENKRMLQELQSQFLDTQGLQEVLVKYGNNIDGLSALHYAIKKGDKHVVELLLDRGADVNALDILYNESGAVSGIIALHRAILANQPEITCLLLDRGADFTLVNKNRGWGWSAIHYAAEVGNAEIINLLIKHGADVNANARDFKDPHNPGEVRSPLHIAAEVGNFDAVVSLVINGAEINLCGYTQQHTDWKRGTPLDFAAYILKFSNNPKNLELVRFLVEHGGERKFRNYIGCSAPVPPCPVINGYLQSISK
jgi:ankyrin repeat protein